tara:strand:+ start:1277 stop:2206 length:930 start_codon:yes stop_codon:yes gene_type:complete
MAERKSEVEEYKPDLVIYHDKCMDGFTAAWAIWKRWPDAEFIARNYGQVPPPDLDGLHVLIVDFSFSEVILRDMVDNGRAASVVILDHHKTAQADLEPFAVFKEKPERFTLPVVSGMTRELIGGGYCPILALFDMDRSGAGMAWDFAHGADKGSRPGLVNLVEDRDLWRFAHGDRSKNLHLALQTSILSFGRWDEIEDNLASVIEQGAAIAAWRDQLVEEIIERAHYRHIGGKRGIVVHCPYGLASDVCHALLDEFEDAAFAAAIVCSGEETSFSLRSRDDRADVSEIARKWGGGGHRNAAGFKVPSGG